MAPAAEVVQCSTTTAQYLLEAQLELWHIALGFIKSLALKSALDLRIADAISHHGGTATLPEIATARLYISPFFGLREWLQREQLAEQSLFEDAHGQKPWDLADGAGGNSNFGELFNQGMLADNSFTMDVAVKECGEVFRGLSSVIDEAGGLGGAAQTIAKAFPHVTCSVLDLPHISRKLPVAPWILHDWGDTECIKILKNCKKAIPPRDSGGKVIILDMVVGAGSANAKLKETQVLFDLLIMTINGTERDEKEWKKIIFEAGFSDYKIIPVLGVRSIIEVYP
ncbi:hypothetical protein EJB05_13300, partial [Eragrostis curvula]